ncbi:glycosyltransferase family 4 protein [Baaleninema sp.]|uniref:glycosyltransferase family 4 protein n=1 Tax=Baaleninema sp. TaxID=3101197 RepID=UPI003D062441
MTATNESPPPLKTGSIDTASVRVAWLLTSAFYYWQPAMKCLTDLFPNTTVYTSRWHGFAPGLEDSFHVDIVGGRKLVALKKADKGYGSTFTYLPLQIVGRLLKFKPDILFSNAFGLWTLLALIFKPFGGWRVVIAYEGSSPSVDYRNSPLRLALRRWMVQTADACISNSHAGRDYLIQILNSSPKLTFVQPYEVPGTESLKIDSSELEIELSDLQNPRFLYVGSLIFRKGLKPWLESCADLERRKIGDYSIIIVGDGERREELEAFCREKKIEHRVRWVGRVPYHQLGAYFQQSDIFVLPTFEDTWGMVVLEAMVLGKPVLCSEYAGAVELIRDGENGYRCNPEKTAEFSTLMAKFVENSDLSNYLGKNARKTMENYTPEAAADFMKQVIERVLGGESND